MKDVLVEYNYQWSVISNEHRVSYRKVFPITEIDEIICNLIHIQGGETSLTDLGLMLGFAMADIVINDDIKFYYDYTEVNVFNNILKNLTEYHLIEISDNKVFLTYWGNWAIENKQKFKFYSGDINLFNHLHFTIDEKYFPICFSDLDLFSTIKHQKVISPYEILSLQSDITKKTITYFSLNPDSKTIIIDSVYDSFDDKSIIDKDVIVKLSSDLQSVYIYFKDKILDDISNSLLLEDNNELRNHLIKRGLFEKLLSSDSIFGLDVLYEYKEFFDWVNIISSGRIDWSASGIFEFFMESDVSNGNIWSLISRFCPIDILIKEINTISDYVNWSVITSNASADFIIENFNLLWDIDIALDKIPPENLFDFVSKKLSDVSSEEYSLIIGSEQWNIITSKIPLEILQATLIDYPYNYKYITRTYVELTVSKILTEEYTVLDWDWNYISSNYDLDFLAFNFNLFSKFLNPEKLFLRIASEEERLLRFLRSSKTNDLKQRLFDDDIKISYHDVVLNEKTLPLLDNNNLLSWGTNIIPGVEANNNIKWSNELFLQYGAKLLSNQAISHVSKSFDDIKIVLNNPSFNWNYINVFEYLDSSSILSNLPQLYKNIPSSYLIQIYSILSDKFSLKEALLSIKILPVLAKNLDLVYIINKTTLQELEENIFELNSYFHLLDDIKKSVIYSCTSIASLDFILENTTLQWDWSLVTRNKIFKEDIEEYFEDFTQFLDWEYIIKNILKGEYLNNITNLTKLAVYISHSNDETHTKSWSLITSLILPENIWTYISTTVEYEFFKWDWSIISGSSNFMFSKFNDIAFLWTNRQKIDWVAFTSNSLFKNWLKKVDVEDLSVWFERTTEFVDTFIDYIVWDELSRLNDFTWFEKIVRKYSRYWNWSVLSQFSPIFIRFSEKKRKSFFVNKIIGQFKNRIDFFALSSRMDVIIEPDFVFEFSHENLNWAFLSSSTNFKITPDLFIKRINESSFELVKDRFYANIADKNWDYLFLSNRQDFELNSDLLLLLSEKPWDWSALSSKSFITNTLLLETSDKPWDFSVICENKELIFDINLLKLIQQKAVDFTLDWYKITSFPNFHVTNETLSIISSELIPNLNWDCISANPNLNSETLSTAFLDKYGKYLNWDQLLSTDKLKLSESLIVKFHKYISPTAFAKHIDITILQKNEFSFVKDLINWSELCNRPDIVDLLNDQHFIEINKKYINWSTLSSNIHLPFTESFIKHYILYWNWNCLLQNPVIKEKFKDFVLNIIHTDKRLDFYIKISQNSSRWSGYIYHFAHLSNAVKIIKDKCIMSRNKAVFEDSAGSVVNRRHEAHAFARFYFRPQTPTQFYNENLGLDFTSKYFDKAYNMGLPKCPIPVFFRFSLKDVLFDDSLDYRISNGNMQTNWAYPYPIESISEYFDFKNVYSTINNTTDNDYRTYIDRSQQEFLIKDRFDFSDYVDYNIIVPNNYVKNYLINIIDDPIISRKIIVDTHSSDVLHGQNKSINFNYENKTLLVSTDYRNDHKFQLRFQSEYDIKELNAEDLVNKTNAIEFKNHCAITFSNEPQFELLFFNEIKPTPWTIFKFGMQNHNQKPQENQVFSDDVFIQYSPANLIKQIKHSFPSLNNHFESQVRHYKIEHHSLLVCSQYEKYFSKIKLPSVSNNCFRFFLALHDIGKPIAFKKGNKNEQYQYTMDIIRDIWPGTSFSEIELKIILALITSDPFGEYLQNKLSLQETYQSIKNLASKAQLPQSIFFKIFIIYYQCDIAAYTADAGGFAFLEHLFSYHNNEKVFDPDEELLKFSPSVNEKYLALKNIINS